MGNASLKTGSVTMRRIVKMGQMRHSTVLVGRVLASTLLVLKELASQGSTGVIESLTARMERMREAATTLCVQN